MKFFVAVLLLVLFMMFISFSEMSFRMTTKTYINAQGAKMHKCTYFTGYSFFDRDFPAQRGCPYQLKQPK